MTSSPDYPAYSTPLAQILGERVSQLVPAYLTTIEELLALEHARTIEARRWALSARRKRDVLTVTFVTGLHHRMFDGIWKWAGQLRRSDHAEGVRWPTIAIELNDLLSEVRFWRERKLYSGDEIALRFHHRLFRIRAFEGGTGSHARLAADAVVAALGRPPFDWGMHEETSTTATRERYLSALRDADAGVFQSLREFARMTPRQAFE